MRACRFPECKQKVKESKRYCEECKRIMREQVAAVNALLFPPRQPYTPRVYTVAPFERG